MSQITNRIDHVAWMCRPENHDAYVEKLSKLFNVTFEANDGGPDFGLRFTGSWSSRREVLSPAGESPHAQMCWKLLEEKGEGLFAIVMGVADVEETAQRAREMGYTPSPLMLLHGDLEEGACQGRQALRPREGMAAARPGLHRMRPRALARRQPSDRPDRHRRARPGPGRLAGGAVKGRAGGVAVLNRSS